MIPWWLAVLAIVLHTAAPFYGTSLHSKAPQPQAHDHGTHEHGGFSTAAHHAPNSPGEICIGDCPISIGGKSPLVLYAGPAVVLSATVSIPARVAAFITPRAFDPAVFHQPRAPPVFT